jgi:hypothetical protein
MGNNRRKNERINISLEVMMESSSGKREVRISDLSEGGCFVDSISTMNTGENVSLKTLIPTTNEWVELKGEVVSVFPGIGFGVQFTRLSEKELTRLKQLIVARSGKAPSEPSMKGEEETNSSIESTGSKETDVNAQNKSFNEFEEFVEDLLGDDARKEQD